ncbi:MAG: hypothetical protein HQK51_12460 [Oligoflexia bacterium]|nr:hypothetical protein [Oligoflexia bacterium]
MSIGKQVFLSLTLLVISSSAFSMAAWNGSNRPDLMVPNYNNTFSKLPTSGQLSKMPWSDDYWPTYKGGITYRWNQQSGDEVQKYAYSLMSTDKIRKGIQSQELSPAEKFDIYLGRYDFPLTKYERKRTQILRTVQRSSEFDKNFEIPTWEGLCHAWAPATMLYQNPNPVKVINPHGIEVEFGSSDIKALLVYFLHLNNGRTNFLGSRCNLSFQDLNNKVGSSLMTEEEMMAKMNSPECADTNAGAFHVALVNQIALLDEGFVADVTRDAEVWNQPVYGFKTRVLETEKSDPRVVAAGTVKEITVETEMYYISEVAQTWYHVKDHKGLESKVYQYTLELDARGRIIGGEWLSEERPDFIWKQTKPSFSGFFAPLKAIYEKSIR